MKIVYEVPYIKSFSFVSVNEILSYAFFLKKKPTTKHKKHLVMLIFEMGVFLPFFS